MIHGVGVDMVDIRRIEKTLAKFGERFLEKHFTEKERAVGAERKHHILAYWAKRFAAKEACSKALGLGIGRNANWHDMEILSEASGKPGLTLQGNALAYLQFLHAGASFRAHLSLSDEYPYAQAYVVIEIIHA